MYNCGPTVYSRAHIGNLASYLFADFLRRWLEASGYSVRQVKNITDVGHLTQDDFDAGEDKMIAAAKKEGKGVEEVARLYSDLYVADENALNMLEPEARPRATEYIQQQIEMVEALIERGHAYEVDGNVYFDVTTFPHYGALSGNDITELNAGARVEVDTNKRNAADFLLWRHAAEDHLLVWDSPWGKGYPGWHIECSAMSRALLGDQLDIHTGGEDNIFPHHESEIAQTSSLTGKPMANYWLHRRHILVGGEKMAKSAGNFYSLGDIEAHGFHPLDFRFLVFGSHYRQKMDFSWDAMTQAREGLRRILTFKERLSHSEQDLSAGTHILETTARERVIAALDDDLNTPEALAAVYDFVRDGNALLDKGGDDAAAFVLSAQHFINWFDRVLGVLGDYPSSSSVLSEERKAEVDDLVAEREEARASKEFTRADEIRDQLAAEGIELEDGPTGPTWHLR